MIFEYLGGDNYLAPTDIWDFRYDTDKDYDDIKRNEVPYNYYGNKLLADNQWSSGSLWQDALFDLASLYGSFSKSNRPQYTYMDAQYKGNGLADTSLKTVENKNYYNPYATNLWAKQMARNMKYGFGNRNNLVDQLRNMFGTKQLGDVQSNNDLGTRQTVEYGNSPYSYTNYLGTDTASQLNGINSINYAPKTIFDKWGGADNYKGNFESYFG